MSDMHASFSNEVSFLYVYILTYFKLCYIFILFSTFITQCYEFSSWCCAFMKFNLSFCCILFPWMQPPYFIFQFFHLWTPVLLPNHHYCTLTKTRVMKFKYLSAFGSLQTFPGKYTPWQLQQFVEVICHMNWQKKIPCILFSAYKIQIQFNTLFS